MTSDSLYKKLFMDPSKKMVNTKYLDPIILFHDRKDCTQTAKILNDFIIKLKEKNWTIRNFEFSPPPPIPRAKPSDPNQSAGHGWAVHVGSYSIPINASKIRSKFSKSRRHCWSERIRDRGTGKIFERVLVAPKDMTVRRDVFLNEIRKECPTGVTPRIIEITN